MLNMHCFLLNKIRNCFTTIIVMLTMNVTRITFIILTKLEVILQIRETPHKRHHKFIEFYDVRAVEKTLKVLNKSDIVGKRIKLEPIHHGGARMWYY